MSEDKPETKQDALTTAEVAGLFKATWTALITPKWPKDDLIELGKLIYAKVPLSKIDADLYGRLRPHLVAMVQELGKYVKTTYAAPATATAPAAEEKKDG